MLEATFYKNIFTDYISNFTSDYIATKYNNFSIDQKSFYSFMVENWDNSRYSGYIPREYTDSTSIDQITLASKIGYMADNTLKRDWGINPSHNNIFKDILGYDFFNLVNLNPDKTQIRLLCYEPGNMLPLHWDGYEAWQHKFNTKQVPIRYSVLVNNWSYGQYLQINNTVVTNWEAGDIYCIPNKILHCSGNGGIIPKVTLTITGTD